MSRGVNSKAVHLGNTSAYRWLLAGLTVMVIAFGWKYPYLGFVVPLAMGAGMLGGVFGGRYVCGRICPRGSLLDKVLSRISPAKKTPEIFQRAGFRWTVFVALIGFMFYRASSDFTSPAHWGNVFWFMCTVTTAIALIGAVVFNARFWCSVCPVGTFASTVGGTKSQPVMDTEKCTGCDICASACPMLIHPAEYASKGAISDPDCLRCGACAATCPKDAISMK